MGGAYAFPPCAWVASALDNHASERAALSRGSPFADAVPRTVPPALRTHSRLGRYQILIRRRNSRQSRTWKPQRPGRCHSPFYFGLIAPATTAVALSMPLQPLEGHRLCSKNIKQASLLASQLLWLSRNSAFGALNEEARRRVPHGPSPYDTSPIYYY